MADISREAVLAQLSKVKGPDLKDDLVSLGLIDGLLVKDGTVIFSITVPSSRAGELEPLRSAAEKAVADLPGVKKVTAILTAERKQGEASAARPAQTPPGQPTGQAGGQPAGQQKIGIPGITSIIAVASGKGGVGKSTTSVNLALALQAKGKKVGILDADIYGPSMPRLLGITDKPHAEGKTLSPMSAFGLKVMSMGFLVEEDTPMIWRGPMVISALTQMLRDVAWGELDILVVDMPPGTGDAQLTMAQKVPLAGAVIVSTPQDIALIDARKGLNMFRRVDVPILGIIENMSTFICPKCGERSDIFGHGGAREEAARAGVKFLGEVPLHMDIRSHSDGGTPVVVSQPEGPHARTYLEIADRVLESLESDGTSAGPAIIFE
jgi:ATP-binding protein involved in chromosome partitioning